MVRNWIWSSVPDVAMVAVTGICVYAAVIIATRLTGLRSFAKFSSFDFAMTIAVGSLISSALLTEDPPLVHAITGVITIFALQRVIAVLRRHPPIARLVDNNPTVLMKNGEIVYENMRKTAVTEDDLRSILRQRNVSDVSTVHAVVLETTGDISVLHARDADLHVDPWLMEGVFGADRFDT